LKNKSVHLITFRLPLALATLALLTISGCSSGSNTTVAETNGNTLPMQTSSTAVPGMEGSGQGGMMGRSSSGTLESINGNTLILSTQQGQIDITVKADTVYQKVVTGSAADLQKGLTLSVMGTSGTDNRITAASIVIRPEGQNNQTGFPGGMGSGNGKGGMPGGQNPPTGAVPDATGMPQQPNGGTSSGFPSGGQGRQGTMGTLTAINGNTLTLTGVQGEEITVSLSADTTIQKTVTCALSDLQKGQSVSVMGSRDSNNGLTAELVMVE
jgi:hypothetical protein